MNKLTAICNRMTAMLEEYDARVDAATNRIITLGEEMQTAKEAMTAAAAADDMTTYQEAEARVRYLSARIEAEKSVQIKPVFTDKEAAVAFVQEYRAALHEAIRPVYARLLETMKDQKALVKQLETMSNELYTPVIGIQPHIVKAGYNIYPWNVHPLIIKHFCDADAVEQYMLDVENE